jgi:DNA-binding SARP family transcriptional activator
VEAFAADDSPIPLGPARQRALLAVLALRANSAVAAEALRDAAWDPPHPSSAVQLLHTYLCRLRRAIQPDSPRWRRQGMLSTVNGSYRLSLPPSALDVSVMERQVAHAATARSRGDLPAARDLLLAASSAWRGEPLAGLPGPLLRSERLRLQEKWLSVMQNRLELDLQIGRHGEILPDLQGLVAQHPLRERLVELLMLALYREGRQGDALHVYTATRHRLDDELGIGPSVRLQQLYVSMLRGDPDLLPTAGSIDSVVAVIAGCT